MNLSRAQLPSFRPSEQARFGWGRIDAFIDAVYAIAATLLVLELRPPDAEPGKLGSALIDQWPIYLVYALGFIQIVAGWGVLRRISAWSRGLDHYSMLLVMVTMLTYALQPFTLAVLSDAVHDREDFTAGIRLLSIALLVSMLAFAALMLYLRNRELFRTDALDAARFELAYRLATTAWIWPLLALVLSFVIGPYALLPIFLFMTISLMPLEALPAGVDESPDGVA
jgi:uncharacterized membrane protein